MNLIIDQGNTRTKIALFSQGKMLRKTILDVASVNLIIEWCAQEVPDKVLVSSVVSNQLFEELSKEFDFEVYNLTHTTKLPFTLNYKTPETLGLDRMALAAAAFSKFPGKDCLVVDAGTCITYDFVNSGGEYLGGGISPGLQMRFKALNHFTARLPLAGAGNLKGLIGQSTMESIASGVINGAANEVEGTINCYAARFPEMITVLTGGDVSLFDGLAKNTIFAAPEFLLEGLNYILDYHAEMR